MRKITGILLLITIICSACSSKGAEHEAEQIELSVSAASSLTLVLAELEKLFEQKNPNINVVINYGSSGTLVNQLKQGAPGDLILLASQAWMDHAVESGIVERNEEVPLLKNRLVLAGLADSSLRRIEDLLDSEVNKIAVGDPASVPAGAYAKQALTAREIWSEVRTKVVFAKSARQTAMYIASGNTDAGIVFESDLTTFPDLKQLQVIPQKLHDSIVYSAAITKQASERQSAKALLDFLQTNEAADIFQNHGFRLN